MKTATMTIYAEALADNRNYKNARIDGKTVGVADARKWANAVKAMRIPAYAVAQYRHANLANAEIAAPCDLSALYSALHTVLDLVGEVNGAKLHAENIAEIVVANASRIRTIDISVEMADARFAKRQAKKALDNYDQGDKSKAESLLEITTLEHNYDLCKAEVERLESEPNNCKKLFEINAESAFIKAVEIALGDAINGQCMKSAEQVAAEEEAKRQARRAKTAEKRKAAKANANK